MLKTKKINNIKISPFVNKNFDEKRVKANKYFPEPFANIALIARKKSGKTTVLCETVLKCASTKTKVFIFASTVEKDDNYKELLKTLDDREIEYYTYLSLKDDKADVLKEIVEQLKREHEEEEVKEKPQEVDPANKILMFCTVEEEEEYYRKLAKEEKEGKKKPKEKKQKGKIYPKYIFVFDDLSTELKNKNVEALLKCNRHIQSKVIVSTQWLNDLSPGSRRQFDYFLIFKGVVSEKLEQIYKDADLHLEYDEFEKVYNMATDKPYSFLYIDVINGKFRRNFNEEIET